MWNEVFNGMITKDWQYTPIVKTSQIRIRYRSSPDHVFYSRFLIRRRLLIDGVESTYYAGQVINERNDQVLSLKNQPSMFKESQIGFRRNRKFNFDWNIAIDYWSDPNETAIATIKTYYFAELPLRDNGVEGVPAVHWLLTHNQNTLRPVLEFYDEMDKPQLADFVPLDENRVAIIESDIEANPGWSVTVIGREG